MTEEEHQRIVSVLRQRVENTPEVLSATQASVSVPIIERIAKKIQHNLFASTITVTANKICQGHHRYLAALLIQSEIKTQPGTLRREQPSYSLSELNFDRDDWDESADVDRYIQEAAQFYHRDVAEIRILLSDSLIL